MPSSSDTMRAARVHAYGGPEAVIVERLPPPGPPGPGEALVRVAAAGAGPWDSWIRAGKSVVPHALPLTLGSDLSGTVDAVGHGVTGLTPGDEVFGVTNMAFTGAWADLALAEAARLAAKPRTLDHVQAAAAPVVAVTAWQMLFDHAGVAAGRRVLVHGAAGSVGSYAVQLAAGAGAEVIGTAAADDLRRVRELGAARAIDAHGAPFEEAMGGEVDAVIDLVGGEAQERSIAVLKPGGVLVSAVSRPDERRAASRGVRAFFMLVDVQGAVLAEIARLIDQGRLRAGIVGEVLPLEEAAQVHRMLDGEEPHRRGKLVLDLTSPS